MRTKARRIEGVEKRDLMRGPCKEIGCCCCRMGSCAILGKADDCEEAKDLPAETRCRSIDVDESGRMDEG